MPQSTFINPVVLPEQLNAAERKFVRCMAAGELCLFGEKRPAKKIDKGENANVIRADVIRFFVWGGSEQNPIAGSTISLGGAHISGALDLFLVYSPYALALMDCRFDASVMMLHAKFCALNLSGSFLPHGLSGGGMHIDGSFFMRGGFSAEGEVGLVNSDIGGDVDCGNSEFNNEKGYALVADRIKVGGDFIMHENFSAKGAVQLLNADVGGNVNCNGGKFINRTGDALAADCIKVGGSFSMQNHFAAEGMVRLLNADIGTEVYCINSEFKNDKGEALVANNIKVGGNFLLLDNCIVRGELSLAGADIGGDLCCNGGKFMKGLNAKAAKIGNSLHWQDVGGCGTVDLSYAVVDVLEDDEQSRENFDFHLDGFSYQRFESPGKVESRIKKWLDKRPPGARFSPQPFEHAAKVLFAMGHNNDARKVLLKKERLLTEKGQLSDRHKWLRRWWDRLAGYGYEWWRTLGAAAAVVGLGWAVFLGANYYGHIVPHQPVVMAKVEEETKKGHECTKHSPTEAAVCLLPQYPRFDALAYSADVFIPFFALHQEQYWYPQPRDKGAYLARLFLTLFLWLEIIAGWLLTSLFVLTITGLLKPRQSSLE